MCERCVENVRKYFPDVPDDEMGDFLLSATAFPFATVEQTEAQIAELRTKSGGDWRKAIGIACEEADEAMQEAYKHNRARTRT